MNHFYEDGDGKRRECGDEFGFCDACWEKERAEWAAYYGVEWALNNVNARHLSESKDEAERIEAECKEAGRP